MNVLIQQEREKQPFHMHGDIRFQVIPVSPSATHTPLQIVCFFDHRLNSELAGGTALVNEHFKGAIKELRAADEFRGERFETLLLIPTLEQIPAQKLLLVGLGDPATFDIGVINSVGHLSLQEAVKLGVHSFCFAPSIKDAGIEGFAAGDVSIAIVQGMMRAIKNLNALVAKQLLPALVLREVTLLAGAAHLENSQAGVRQTLGK